MDGKRFDDLARTLASGFSRRGLFKTAAAGAAGLSLRFGRSLPASAAPCSSDIECGGGSICCNDGTCLQGQCCITDADPNLRCPSGTSCFEGVCDPIPECYQNSDCPNEYLCIAGVCTEPSGLGCCAIWQAGGNCAPGDCCTLVPFPDNFCDPGFSCSAYSGNEGSCSRLVCNIDEDCAPGSICCQNGSCYEGQCCTFDALPNRHCPEGTVCFEGVCDPVKECVQDSTCPTGNRCEQGQCVPKRGPCCDAQRDGNACEPNTCCMLAASPSDFCPVGSSCVGEPFSDGVCCVVENQRCVSGTPCCDGLNCNDGTCTKEVAAEPETTPKPAVDKYSLWTGSKTSLLGATIYQRWVTDVDDEERMGAGPIGPVYRDADFKRLAKLGANYVELSHPASRSDQAPYKGTSDAVDSLAALVDQAAEADLWAVISYRTGPGIDESIAAGYPVCRAGGCFASDAIDSDVVILSAPLWDDKEARDAWVRLWRETAKRYANNPTVIGYHLLAMPSVLETEPYLELLERIVAAIREVDEETPILISAPGNGLPDDLGALKPIDDERTVYRVEAFAPARYFKQEVGADDALAYGDDFDPDLDRDEGTFDAGWIRSFLKPALDWTADNRAPVAIGGYGIPRWQPNLSDYLDDLLAYFSKNKLRTSLWLWHPAESGASDDAFNLEYGDDPDQHEATDNDLIDLIADYWDSNQVRPST